MRRLVPVLLLLVAPATGCPSKTSYPGDACDEYISCYGDLECIGYHCVASCKYEGDCDQGYRCHEGSCIATCETQDDCDNFGTCSGLGPERRGKACLLINLPVCSEDWHCGGNFCLDGQCKQWCDSYSYCPTGEKCLFVDDYRGYCAPDPDYVPPPRYCTEAPDPDLWCRDNFRGVTCDLTSRSCTSPLVGFKIEDVSYSAESGGTICSEFEDDPLAGSDIAAVEVRDAQGNLVPLQLESVYFGISGGELVYDEAILNREPICDETAVSLGCRGSLTLTTHEGTGVVVPMPSGGTIAIADQEAVCGLGNLDRFNVTMCRDERALGYGIMCNGFLLLSAGAEVSEATIP